MRGKMTYSAVGFNDFIVSRVIVKLIPVAKGSTKASLIEGYPSILFIALINIFLVSFTTSDEPIALGCSALTSPDLPIP